MMRQVPNACVRSTLDGVTQVAGIGPHSATEEYGVSLNGNPCAASVTLAVHKRSTTLSSSPSLSLLAHFLYLY